MSVSVIFSRNRDRRTCNMFIDNQLMNEDIPFIPELAVDHRGMELVFYLADKFPNNTIDELWELVNLDVYTEKPFIIMAGFKYWKDPKYIKEGIEERLQIRTSFNNNLKHY